MFLDVVLTILCVTLVCQVFLEHKFYSDRKRKFDIEIRNMKETIERYNRQVEVLYGMVDDVKRHRKWIVDLTSKVERIVNYLQGKDIDLKEVADGKTKRV